MNANRRVKLLLGRAALQRHGKALHQLARTLTHHVHTAHALVGLGDDEFEEDMLWLGPHAVGQRPEAGLENLHRAKALAGHLFRQAYGANLWMREHRRRHQLVIRRALAALAKQVMGHHRALSQRHRGQRHAVNHIAHGVNGRHVGGEVRIHLHRALVVAVHACRFKAQTFRIRHAARGVHHAVHHQMLAALQLQVQAVLLFVDGLNFFIPAEVHALQRHLLRQMQAQIGIKAPQQLTVAVNQGGLRAQPVEDGSELNRDIAATHHHHALRHLFEVKCLVRADGMLHTRYRRQTRCAACGDQNVMSADSLAVHQHAVSA